MRFAAIAALLALTQAVQLEAEVDAELELDAEAEVDAEAELDAQLDVELDAEAEAEIQAEVDAEAEAEQMAEVEEGVDAELDELLSRSTVNHKAIVEAIFKALDKNQDNQITRAELIRYVNRQFRYRYNRINKTYRRHAKSLRRSYQRQARRLRTRVTRQRRYLRAYRKRVLKKALSQFKAVDANSNGKVTRGELEKALKKHLR